MYAVVYNKRKQDYQLEPFNLITALLLAMSPNFNIVITGSKGFCQDTLNKIKGQS